MIKNENYIQIQGWMINELELKGNELLIYAIIYGFTQDDKSWFTGTAAYLNEWVSISKTTIYNILKNLTEKGYLEKTSIANDYNIIITKYKCTPIKNIVTGTQETYGGTQESNSDVNTGENKICVGTQESFVGTQISCCNNNKYNTKNNNNISKDIENFKILETPIIEKPIIENDKLVKPKKVSPLVKPKKKNNKKDWLVMQQMIDGFTTSPDVISALKKYYNWRKKVGLTPEQLRLILDKLRDDCGTNADLAIESINNSLANGWRQIYTSNNKSKKPTFDNTSTHKIPKPLGKMSLIEQAEYKEKNLVKNQNGTFRGF